MKITRIFFLSFFLSCVFTCSGQKKDSIAVKKIAIDKSIFSGRKYSKVSFKFFLIGTDKPIKLSTVDIDDFRLITDVNCINSLISVYLSPKEHSVAVNFPMYEKTRIFSVVTDLDYDYEITIYLSPTKKSLHDV